MKVDYREIDGGHGRMTEKRMASVTGGSRGIGRAICLELAKGGYYLVVNYLSNLQAAKAGLEGASRTLAREVARLGVRVNVVAPGLVETEMTEEFPKNLIKQLVPIGRAGFPEEMAKVVRFLCSDDASYITGQVIQVNGGMI